MPHYAIPPRKRADGSFDVQNWQHRRDIAARRERRRSNHFLEGAAFGRTAAGATSLGAIGRVGGGYNGVLFRRPDGTAALTAFATPDGGENFIAMWDRQGNVVHSDDAESGRGIGRPYLHYPLGELLPPTATTTSDAFLDIIAGTVTVQHPGWLLHAIVQADTGTAGEWQLVVDGAVQGDAQPIAAGVYAETYLGPVRASEPPYGALSRAAVQARVTSGSGKVGVRVLSLLGLESSYLPPGA